jgi:hypothetical protein
MVSPGIRFNDCLFTEPTRLTDWKVPLYAGLFVILAKDANWAPKPYRPMYFGEFGNNTPPAAPTGNHTLPPHGEADTTLLVSVLPMPFSTTAQRWALRNELLWAYNSAWQTKELQGATSGLANQRPEVDNEAYPGHSGQILPHLTGVNTQPEPRRRIGFLP